MPLHLPRRRIWRTAIYLVSLLLILLAADLLLVQARRSFHPGFETTRIMAPLHRDGTIDYLTALEDYFSTGVTPNNNAMPLILRALGRTALPANQPADGITDKLGMPHLPEQGDYYVPYAEYCKQHGVVPEDDPTDPTGTIVFPMSISPQTRQWIEANERPLALLAEASRRPRFFIPFNGGKQPQTMIEIQIPHVSLLRETRRPLLTRSMLRLTTGDYAGFHDDLMTAHRLARLLAKASTLVERMVAMNEIEIPACAVERAAAASGKLSAEQCKALAVELAALGDLPSLADAWAVGERYMGLDVLQMMARAGPIRAGEYLNAAITPGPVARIEPSLAYLFIPIPYEQSMRAINHFHDSAMAAMQLATYPQRAAMMRLWTQHVSETTRHGPVMILTTPDWAIAIFLSQLEKTLIHADIARMQNHLTRVALALAAFKADHGSYPAALDELSPQYLSAIPVDLFSEKPIIYSRTAEGYSMRSVGPNMTDDQGRKGKPWDDLSVP